MADRISLRLGQRNMNVFRTVVVTLSVCVRRFSANWEDGDQRSFDERFESIERGAPTQRALAFFVHLARGRATRAEYGSVDKVFAHAALVDLARCGPRRPR